jgi:hypothetical protein
MDSTAFQNVVKRVDFRIVALDVPHMRYNVNMTKKKTSIRYSDEAKTLIEKLSVRFVTIIAPNRLMSEDVGSKNSNIK